MNTWIFQGNPKHFDMDTYLTENKHITWSVRQKYLADQMQVGDIVFIWRSDGGKKGTGGMIAKSKVTKAPYNAITQLNHAEHWKEDEKVYGARGRNYIEVHHIKPLHQMKETIVNPATDLVPLCANCHRMTHRDPHNVLTPDELKQLLQDMKETD